MSSDDPNQSFRFLRAWDRRLSQGAWRESVVRRAAMLLFVVAPGLALNFLLAIVTAQILETADFGIFYFGLTVSQLFAAPSIILSFFLARQFARIAEADGEEAAWRAAPALFRRALVMIAVIVGGAFVAVMAASIALKVEAPWLVPIIALHVASFYLIDMTRGFLNGMHRFLVLGVLGTIWMAGRFVLGVLGAFLTGTVWASLLGVALAGFVAAGGFFLALGRRLRVNPDKGLANTHVHGGELRDLPMFAVGYGLAIAIAYLDILMGYLVLDREALGAYSASAVLPKGVFTLTLPIVQVMFASLIGREGAAGGYLVARTLTMTAAMTLVGAAIMWFGHDAVCGGEPWRIGACEATLLGQMALAVVPISLIRCLVAMQLAKGASRHPALLIVPVAGFAIYCLQQVGGTADLARAFNVFVMGTLVYYAACCRFGSARQT